MTDPDDAAESDPEVESAQQVAIRAVQRMRQATEDDDVEFLRLIFDWMRAREREGWTVQRTTSEVMLGLVGLAAQFAVFLDQHTFPGWADRVMFAWSALEGLPDIDDTEETGLD